MYKYEFKTLVTTIDRLGFDKVPDPDPIEVRVFANHQQDITEKIFHLMGDPPAFKQWYVTIVSIREVLGNGNIGD